MQTILLTDSGSLEIKNSQCFYFASFKGELQSLLVLVILIQTYFYGTKLKHCRYVVKEKSVPLLSMCLYEFIVL